MNKRLISEYVCIIGGVISLISEIYLLLILKTDSIEVRLFGIFLIGIIIFIIGIIYNRQFYVDNYKAMNPRDRIEE